MNSDPLDLAIRELTDAKRLLETLVTASESFDYFRAKATLDELRLKLRVLGRVQADLASQRAALPDRIIPFPMSSRIQG